MKKKWLLILLILAGCTQVEEETIVEQETPQQQLEQVLEDIKLQIEQQQLVLGETEVHQLSSFEQIDATHYRMTQPFQLTVETVDELVNEMSVSLPESIEAEELNPTISIKEGIEGQWLVENGVVTALQVTRTAPTWKQQVYALPVEEKVGQLIMMGMDGTTMTPALEQALKQIGNVILFKKNITSVEQLRTLMTAIDTVETAYPIWVGIDEEGGRVSRLPNELIKIPTAQILASQFTPQQVEAIAQKLGEALASNGIDIDFAPVMDVNSNAANPVIGDRAFSADVEAVSKYAGHFAKGLQNAGILAVAKHFPGHGDTSVDSHIGLPVIEKSVEQLEQMELRPFKQAVEQGIDSIMVGHLLVPALDATQPASLSAPIVTGLLREQWGYDGLIVTDDLTMGALNKSLPQAILASIQAGNDMALANGSLPDVLAGKQLVVEAVEAGVIPTQQINASAYRILSRKQQQNLTDFSVEQWNNEMKALLQ